MTIKKLYSIRDIKTDNYDSPFDSENDQTAQRFFTRLMSQVPLMHENPQDFTLHAVGTFNSSNAIIHCLPAIQFIASGLDCLKTTQTDATNEKTKVSNDPSIQPSPKG
nr:MAG: nonstructural protein [Microvirus sp.]